MTIADLNPFNCLSSLDLWRGVESDLWEKNDFFEDQDGNQIIWTGESFQVTYSTESNSKYVGLCKDDQWKYVGNFEDENIIDWGYNMRRLKQY